MPFSLTFGGLFDITGKENRLKEIEEIEALEGFWEDRDNASKIQQEKSKLQNVVEAFQTVNGSFEDLQVLIEYFEEGDNDGLNELNINFNNLQEDLSKLEQQSLLNNENDDRNAILSINAGAGGTESCDWAQMLFRMMTRYADTKKFKYKVLETQSGDSAGIKSATILIEGFNAFGLLKSEIGIHRLVRISPFDSNARRHTSFASIFVSPEIDDDIEIDINDKDLKIDVYRSGGAGGQSVNTTDSAVRITHLPTGTVVTCQNERSQIQNKATAMKILRSRLYDLEMQKKKEEQAEVEAGKKEIGWGSQIRSYVLHPYKLVKDHRTNYESSNPQAILDGDLDHFIKEYLQYLSLSNQKSD
ncbi:peptide chain release factor 2 [Bacteriovoracaceae bacterium]|nr:peptide chain release factor 2 [Bacteriovoracaceae bacterium]